MSIRRARGVHYVVAVMVGIASGVALYKEPLEEEARRAALEREREREALERSSSASDRRGRQ